MPGPSSRPERQKGAFVQSYPLDGSARPGNELYLIAKTLFISFRHESWI
jgi:hypothetical protein